MKSYGLYESASVKVCFWPPFHRCGILITSIQIQTLKTAVEAARMLLRVDDVVQAVRKDREQNQGPPPEEMAEG